MWRETLSLFILLNLPGSDSVKSTRLDYMELQNITAAPYAVLVFFNNNKYFCSGTIVDPVWVLTSAHCLYDVDGEFTEDEKSITVVAGTESLYFTKEDVEAGNTQIRQSVAVKVHSGYSWYESFINDLAIIQVTERFEISDRVQVAPRDQSSVAGWRLKAFGDREGHVSQKGSSSCRGFGFGKILREVNSSLDFWLKAQDYEVDKECQCLRRVRLIREPYNILKKNSQYLCDVAGLWTGLCKGDNGGQLMCDGWLRGISTAVILYKDIKMCTLWSGDEEKNECGAVTTLSIFTDLCSHNLWLRENIPGYPSVNETCDPNLDLFSGRSFY